MERGRRPRTISEFALPGREYKFSWIGGRVQLGFSTVVTAVSKQEDDEDDDGKRWSMLVGRDDLDSRAS